jgi:phage-related holin
MELISICENLDKMGVPIPKFISKALADAQKKLEEKGGETNESKDDEHKNG